jgi:cellulose synthase (UDP-forming)
LSIDQLPLAAAFAPIFFVIGGIYLLGPLLPLKRPWARYLLFAAVWLVVLHYLIWRLFETVLPAGLSTEAVWIWFCFVIEILALGDALILYVAFLRTSDRRTEADRHEARLRAMPPDRLPGVDVLIPTYNEPLDVIEKTIVGALSLDYPNFAVWVLDDGRRSWLKAFCIEKGVGYITRPDNKHAKAGNINHAMTQTSAEYFAIFDADFVPQRNFLMRTLGFFENPNVGIVQVPHAFYNHDPMQVNLALRKTMPDDQRFFFESIMPSRDGWNAAFCCGSNSVTRRVALREAGDGLPTGSITEDMLLTLVMLRQGYITRYLCERLAFGLAPESISAFFVQRQRWARGAIQMLFLPEGPLGPGLSFMQRLLFLPTHWLTQSMQSIMSIVTPLVFLWTGAAPLVNVTVVSALFYLVPMVIAILGGTSVFAERKYFPLAALVLGLFQSLKIFPTALTTLLRPHGHIFKVTPKGADAAATGYEAGIFWTASALMMLTFAGLLVNASPDWRIVSQPALVPLVAFWCMINMVQLFLVCMLCLQLPVRRGEERFAIDEPVWLQDGGGGRTLGRTEDISLSGVGLSLLASPAEPYSVGDPIRVYLRDVGHISGHVARVRGDNVGVQFELPHSVERDLLVRKLFTSGLDTTAVATSMWAVTIGMLKRIWVVNSAAQPIVATVNPAPKEEKLPAQTLVIAPRTGPTNLSRLASERRIDAA